MIEVATSLYVNIIDLILSILSHSYVRVARLRRV